MRAKPAQPIEETGKAKLCMRSEDRVRKKRGEEEEWKSGTELQKHKTPPASTQLPNQYIHKTFCNQIVKMNCIRWLE